MSQSATAQLSQHRFGEIRGLIQYGQADRASGRQGATAAAEVPGEKMATADQGQGGRYR
ncbi:MAG: hypothetical protein G8D61_04620 [gamma proteobacterium symbiont of Ctena orbiculata]